MHNDDTFDSLYSDWVADAAAAADDDDDDDPGGAGGFDDLLWGDAACDTAGCGADGGGPGAADDAGLDGYRLLEAPASSPDHQPRHLDKQHRQFLHQRSPGGGRQQQQRDEQDKERQMVETSLIETGCTTSPLAADPSTAEAAAAAAAGALRQGSSGSSRSVQRMDAAASTSLPSSSLPSSAEAAAAARLAVYPNAWYTSGGSSAAPKPTASAPAGGVTSCSSPRPSAGSMRTAEPLTILPTVGVLWPGVAPAQLLQQGAVAGGCGGSSSAPAFGYGPDGSSALPSAGWLSAPTAAAAAALPPLGLAPQQLPQMVFAAGFPGAAAGPFAYAPTPAVVPTQLPLQCSPSQQQPARRAASVNSSGHPSLTGGLGSPVAASTTPRNSAPYAATAGPSSPPPSPAAAAALMPPPHLLQPQPRQLPPPGVASPGFLQHAVISAVQGGHLEITAAALAHLPPIIMQQVLGGLPTQLRGIMMVSIATYFQGQQRGGAGNAAGGGCGGCCGGGVNLQQLQALSQPFGVSQMHHLAGGGWPIAMSSGQTHQMGVEQPQPAAYPAFSCGAGAPPAAAHAMLPAPAGHYAAPPALHQTFAAPEQLMAAGGPAFGQQQPGAVLPYVWLPSPPPPSQAEGPPPTFTANGLAPNMFGLQQLLGGQASLVPPFRSHPLASPVMAASHQVTPSDAQHHQHEMSHDAATSMQMSSGSAYYVN